MIETIRIFRRKEDDIWALYILEFFKFIGCVVCDHIISSDYKSLEIIEDIYEVNIIFGMDDAEKDFRINERFKELKKESGDKSLFLFLKSTDIHADKEVLNCDKCNAVLEEIITGIWGKDILLEEIKFLGSAYSESRIFFALYNEGNRKFIQEYYQFNKKKSTLETMWREAYEQSFKRFAECYNEFNDFRRAHDKYSVYVDYALLLLKYKLNQIEMLLKNNNIFTMEGMLRQANGILQREPAFIRVAYLAGSICRADTKYLRDAENYFLLAIENLKITKKAYRENGFLYYRLGEFYELARSNRKKAGECYYTACRYDKQAYGALYKIALYKTTDERVAQCNELIHILLNGYGMDEIMPKQQIYGYKSLVLLGDTYFELGEYLMAVQSYENAKRILETKSNFYKIFENNEDCTEEVMKDCFAKVVEACMPIQPLLYKIVRCASKYGDKELVDCCYEQMKIEKE